MIMFLEEKARFYFWHLIWPQTRLFVSDDEWKIMDILISIKAWAEGGKGELSEKVKGVERSWTIHKSLRRWSLAEEREEKEPWGKKACRQKRETDRQTMMMHAENRNSRKEKRKGEREKLHNMTPWLNWINNWLRVKSGMTHPFSQCLNESSVAVLRTISLFLRLLLAYCNVRSAFEK